MSNMKITIDGVSVEATPGQTIFETAKENGIYIPTLCNLTTIKPKGSCRICSVYVDGRLMSSCTTPVSNGMVIENNIPKLNDMRLAIVELLFADGNHFCPGCEKSGNCELQALGYRYLMLVPRFAYLFPKGNLESTSPKLMKDYNRCIFCKRCIRGITDENGKSYFAYVRRGHKAAIQADEKMAQKMSDETAKASMAICPVGAIIYKGKGFDEAIGTRKYDKKVIGSDIENKGGSVNE